MTMPETGAAAGWMRSTWSAVTAAVGVVTGLAPHVLHHAGIFAGAFLVAGVAGSLLFGIAGLLLTTPLLLRLYRRFGTWRAPAIAVAGFVVMFSLSTFVLGPALTGEPDRPEDSNDGPARPAPTTDADHDGHHP